MKIFTSDILLYGTDSSPVDCYDSGPIGNCPDDGGGSAGDDI